MVANLILTHGLIGLHSANKIQKNWCFVLVDFDQEIIGLV